MAKIVDTTKYKVGLGANWITNLNPTRIISDNPNAPIPFPFGQCYNKPTSVINRGIVGSGERGQIYQADFAFGGALFLGSPQYVFLEVCKKCEAGDSRIDCVGIEDGFCCINQSTIINLCNRLH